MSTTVTQTLGTSSVPATLRLKEPPSIQIRALLAKMKATLNSLPQEKQTEASQALGEWEEIFFKTYKIDSADAMECKAAAHALLFLRVTHIEFNMMSYVVGKKEQIKWVKFSNEVKEIVASMLSSICDVKTFIEADKKKQLDLRMRYKTAQVIKEVMPKIMAAFAALEKKLYDSVDKVNQNLHDEFEAIKAILAIINQERKVAIVELHGELDKLTEKITQIYQDLEHQLSETRDQGQRIKIIQGTSAHLLNECEAVVKKV